MVNHHLKTTSQAGQDMFAHFISGRIPNGIFVDLGCHNASVHSNSAGLEALGWRGILVDVIPDIGAGRPSPFICSDAAQPSAELLAQYDLLPAQISYLSVDCNGSTWGALKSFPLHRIQCQSVTIEHDRYRAGDGPRDTIREWMRSFGYDLVCADVVAVGYGQFEDWWAHPRWSSRRIRDIIRCEGRQWSEMKT